MSMETLQEEADRMAIEHTKKTGKPSKGIVVSWAEKLMPMVDDIAEEDTN